LTAGCARGIGQIEGKEIVGELCVDIELFLGIG